MATLNDIRVAMNRYRATRLNRDDDLKVAAVAAVFRQGADDAELLFIHRAEDPRDPWSGHMAFPGGRVEPGDRHTLATAMRETREEVGLDLGAEARFLGRLSDVAAVGRGRPLPLVIEPFVFALTGDVGLEPNREVAEIVWVPVGFLLDRGRRSTVPWKHGEMTVQLPCYRYQGHVIWGLTFGMVDELLELLDGSGGGGRWMDPREEL
ncbi:MAG: CoA pyrophosphatase [Thermoanaerobaculales bacterium]|jgi:8-oxo-dGTP pyrophosphatase MutT (NUDIX family)|nr:CoA pyrophosphatase [Thermoanaerobaculales bacterium]